MEEENKYKNFICYRGGSDAGVFFGENLFNALDRFKDELGNTYYSPRGADTKEHRNFKTDPQKYLGHVENFIMLITSSFFKDFLIDGKANPDSITRLEIEEVLKNPNVRFITVLWSDFNWKGKIDGISNEEIVSRLYGEEAFLKITGALPIPLVNVNEKKYTIRSIIDTINPDIAKLYEQFENETPYELQSNDIDNPNNIFIGRENEINEIDRILSTESNILFLQGIAGIGKTQIVKQYVKKFRSKYSKVVCANYNGSIMDLIISQQSPFKIEPAMPRLVISQDEQEGDEAFFKRRLDTIKRISDEKTLVIILNFDEIGASHLSDLVENAKYKLLITTRCDYSRTNYPYLVIDQLSIDELKEVFHSYYDLGLVERDDEHLEELINLVNRHTYTVELLAQHMEISCQTTEEMIEALRDEGVSSLNESIHSSSGEESIAYDNLLKLFTVFDLDDNQKKVMKYLSLMPSNGVQLKDLIRWFGTETGKCISYLVKRSRVNSNDNRFSLHPVVRDIVRNELKVTEEEVASFLKIFNDEIAEEYTWHFSMEKKCFYGDIGMEIIKVFNDINDYTLPIYKNMELLLSFDVKPAKAIEICDRLYNYYKSVDGENSFNCAYYAFQAGWTFLFNLYLPNAVKNAVKWFDISYSIFKKIELKEEDEFAVYGHLLTHKARTCIIYYGVTKDKAYLDSAFEYAKEAVPNAENHLFSPKYGSRAAVAYMQLGEVYIASKEYDKALELFEKSYNIVAEKFGADKPDAINVACRKTAALLGLGRYQEAFDLGKANLEAYKEYFGEFNPLRFEQLIIVYRSAFKIGDAELIDTFKDEIIKVGTQLMGENVNKIQELLTVE